MCILAKRNSIIHKRTFYEGIHKRTLTALTEEFQDESNLIACMEASINWHVL
jgi:hypothetical protein